MRATEAPEFIRGERHEAFQEAAFNVIEKLAGVAYPEPLAVAAAS